MFSRTHTDHLLAVRGPMHTSHTSMHNHPLSLIHSRNRSTKQLAYGVDGGPHLGCCSFPIPSTIHAQAYAATYNMTQWIMWYLFIPVSFCFALFAGVFAGGFSLLFEMAAIRPLAALVGQSIGRLVLAGSGKSDYYDKKTDYYEKKTRLLLATP